MGGRRSGAGTPPAQRPLPRLPPAALRSSVRASRPRMVEVEPASTTRQVPGGHAIDQHRADPQHRPQAVPEPRPGSPGCGRRGPAAGCRTGAGSGPAPAYRASGRGASGRSNSSRPVSARKVTSCGRRRSNTSDRRVSPHHSWQSMTLAGPNASEVSQDHPVDATGRWPSAPRARSRAGRGSGGRRAPRGRAAGPGPGA